MQVHKQVANNYNKNLKFNIQDEMNIHRMSAPITFSGSAMRYQVKCSFFGDIYLKKEKEHTFTFATLLFLKLMECLVAINNIGIIITIPKTQIQNKKYLFNQHCHRIDKLHLSCLHQVRIVQPYH